MYVNFLLVVRKLSINFDTVRKLCNNTIFAHYFQTRPKCTLFNHLVKSSHMITSRTPCIPHLPSISQMEIWKVIVFSLVGSKLYFVLLRFLPLSHIIYGIQLIMSVCVKKSNAYKTRTGFTWFQSGSANRCTRGASRRN